MVELLNCVAAELIFGDLLHGIALSDFRIFGIGACSHFYCEVRLAWEQLMKTLIDAAHVRSVRSHVDAGVVAACTIIITASIIVTAPVQQSIVRAVLNCVHDGLALGLVVSLADADLGKVSVRRLRDMAVWKRTSNMVAKSLLLQRSSPSREMIWPVVWASTNAAFVATISRDVRAVLGCMVLYRCSVRSKCCTFEYSS